MKKTSLFALAALAAMTVSPMGAFATGNGAPSGEHFNLNILGKDKVMASDMTANDGHSIFVNLFGKTKINLAEGPTFQVLDANGTDGNGARFQLPNPDPDKDGTTVYSVYVRALGKPGGKALMTPCANQLVTDPITGIVTEEEICSLANVSVTREKGKSTFTNVSKELLYVWADLNADGVVEMIPLFDDQLQDYFWNYDSSGMKHIQLRFYPQSSTVI